MIEDIDKGWLKILSQVKKFKDHAVLVGLQDDGTAQNGVLVAEYGFQNEYGATLKNGVRIPARPFVGRTADEQKNWLKTVEDEVADIYAGKQNANIALTRVGLKAQGDIIATINKITTPVNAPSTIKKKKSSKPLIDTGLMRSSIKYRVI